MSGHPGRRAVLQSMAGGAMATLAGCLSGADEEPSEETVEPVVVSAESHEVDDPVYSLTFRYATETVKELPGSYQSVSIPDGAKLVILKTRITVTSARSDPLNVREEVVGLRVGEERYEANAFTGVPFIKNSVIPPVSYEAWAWFTVQESVTEATLVAVQPGSWFGAPTEIIFEVDDSITISM